MNKRSLLEQEIESLHRNSSGKPINVCMADLLMMQMIGKFDEFLSKLSESPVDFDYIARQIQETRDQATNKRLFSNIVGKIAKQQFNEGPTVLRELTQNGLDSYVLSDSDRRLWFRAQDQDKYTMLSFRDNGVGMKLRDMVSYLFIPYSTDKERDPHKLGEHGVGWFSIIDMSDVVRVVSKDRETGKSTQAIVYENENGLQAMIASCEQDMFPNLKSGTEVAAFIPIDEENKELMLNADTVAKFLHKYVGYVDPSTAQIFLNRQAVNTLPKQYLQGLPQQVTVEGSTGQLKFGYSKRAIQGYFSDDRFSERNKNLEHLVYTQGGLFVKYGPNPFAQQTIHGRFFSDLISIGVDFWVQLPENVGLTIGRNDIVPELRPDVLDAEYESFRSLFVDSILGDHEILSYKDSRLQEAIATVIHSKYSDYVRRNLRSEYSRSRRILSNIAPAMKSVVSGAYKAGSFIVKAPFKLAYYAALAPYSACAWAVGLVPKINPRVIPKIAGTAALIGVLSYGALQLKNLPWDALKGTDSPIASVSQEEVVAKNDLTDYSTTTGGDDKTEETTVNMKENDPNPFDTTDDSEKTLNSFEDNSKVADAIDDIKIQEKVETGPETTATTANDVTPTDKVSSEDIIVVTEEKETLIQVVTKAIKETTPKVKETVGSGIEKTVSVVSDTKQSLEERLPFESPIARDVTSAVLLGLGGLVSLALAGYASRKAMKATHIKPGTIARYVAQPFLLPLYFAYKVGGGVTGALRGIGNLYQEKLGLYTDVSAKKERKIRQRLQKLVEKYSSEFKTREFIADIVGKHFIDAIHYNPDPDTQGVFASKVEMGSVIGDAVKISIDDLIELFVKDKLRYKDDDRGHSIRPGEYIIDTDNKIVRSVLDELEPIRSNMEAKYDPKVLEDHLDTIKSCFKGMFKFGYFVMGLGPLHILLSCCYKGIKNPYENSKWYRDTRDTIKEVPEALDSIVESGIKYAVKTPKWIAIGVGYTVFGIVAGIFYFAPMYGYKGVAWTASNVVKPVVLIPFKVPGAIAAAYNAIADKINHWKKTRAMRKESERKCRKEARLLELKLQEEARKQAALLKEAEPVKQRSKKYEGNILRELASILGSIITLPYHLACGAISLFGSGVDYLMHGSYNGSIRNRVLDELAVRRIAENVRVGGKYLRFMDAVGYLDVLMAEANGHPRSQVVFYYGNKMQDNHSQLILTSREKSKNTIYINLNVPDVQSLVNTLNRQKGSEFYYQLYESLLHHTAREITGVKYEASDVLHQKKEELRARFVDYMLGQGATLEAALDKAVSVQDLPNQIYPWVDGEKMARLSRLKPLGQIHKREEYKKLYKKDQMKLKAARNIEALRFFRSRQLQA